MRWAAIRGSGPSSTGGPGSARVRSDSQACTGLGRGRPCSTKPVPCARQSTGAPLARDWARADSSTAARRCASRSSALAALSRKARLAPAVAMAIRAITTRSSIRVKPWGLRCADMRVGWTNVSAPPMGEQGLLPAADVGMVALATGLAVGAEGQHVHLALEARVEVLVGMAPGVLRQFVQIGLPVAGHGLGAGLGDQGLKALFGRGVALV